MKHWHVEKAKSGVADKFSKTGWWRLKPQRNFEVTSTELHWTGQEAGKNRAILSKGRNASCQWRADPTRRNFKEFPFSPIMYATRIVVGHGTVAVDYYISLYKIIIIIIINNNNNNNNNNNIYPGRPLALAVFSGALQIIHDKRTKKNYQLSKLKTKKRYKNW